MDLIPLAIFPIVSYLTLCVRIVKVFNEDLFPSSFSLNRIEILKFFNDMLILQGLEVLHLRLIATNYAVENAVIKVLRI